MFATEQRCHIRRELKLPVIFCRLEQEIATAGISTGEISDVGGGGLCVQSEYTRNHNAGDKLLIYVIPEEQEGVSDPESPVEIRAEVVWQNYGQQILGLRYL